MGSGNKFKMFDPPPDEVKAEDDHQLRWKKPPVPTRGIMRRKTWSNQKDETSPVSSLRKTRSEVMNKAAMVIVDEVKIGSTSPRLLRKVKSTPTRLEGSKMSNESEIRKSGSNVERMAFLIEKDVEGSDHECQEKLITSNNVDENKGIDDIDELEKEEEEYDDGIEDEAEIEEKSYDTKEVTVPDKKLRKIIQEEDKDDDAEEEDVKVCDKKAIVVHSAVVEKQPPRYVKRSAFYSDFSKSSQTLPKASTNVVKPTPKQVSKFAKPNPSFTSPATSIPRPHEFKKHPASQDRLQSLVDLVMWRDVSRSAFVFGTGVFVIISSSYTQDLNISFVSVTSYLCLAYLALIFLVRSFLRRGVIHVENDSVVGEEEAIWIVKLVLPYVNEFFLTLQALFSGDPATTMKLAVVLFVLARCGSSITIWKMAKLGFIGAFIVPKVVTSYSLQLKIQCKFWMGRFRDAWETCSHKKIIAGIIFSLIWNLCSVVARVWALFMVAVAFRYYQQLMAEDEEWEVEDVQYSQKEQTGRDGDTSTESVKEKKAT